MKSVHWFNLVLGVIVVGVSVYSGVVTYRLKESTHYYPWDRAVTPVSSSSILTPSTGTSGSMSGSRDPREKSDLRVKSDLREKSTKTLEKIGKDLSPEFSPEGRLIAVTGTPRPELTRETDFKPSREDLVVQRSRALITDLEPALGLAPGTRLGTPRVQPGDVSAQVYFQQSLDGVPVAPFGSVILLLGPAGEVLRVDNGALSDIHLVGDVKLSVEEARLAAGIVASRMVEGGELVIWAPTAEGDARKAYQFESQGRPIVVDAGSGKILLNRDRRMR